MKLVNSKNTFIRKGSALIQRRAKRFESCDASAYVGRPSIVINSVPKSGTHLLTQIISALPGVRSRGEFYASTPSLTLREVGADQIAKRLRALTPLEMAPAHLFYSELVERTFAEMGVLHYLIYRDPRDVALSEAKYLAGMNRWHRMHKYFARLESEDDRLMLAIEGLREQPTLYPDIGTRLSRYIPWLKVSSVKSVRFEDLNGPNRHIEVASIVDQFTAVATVGVGKDVLIERCLDAIDPRKSHTFRSGERGQWRTYFKDHHIQAFKRYAGNVLVELGYEEDMSW